MVGKKVLGIRYLVGLRLMLNEKAIIDSDLSILINASIIFMALLMVLIAHPNTPLSITLD